MDRLVGLAHHIKRLASQGVILRATMDSAGLTLHFELVFHDRSCAKRIAWEEIVAARIDVIDKAVNDSVTSLKAGLDPLTDMGYGFATGGAVDPSKHQYEAPRETVVTLAQFRQLKVGSGP